LHLPRRHCGFSGFNVSPAAAQVNGVVRPQETRNLCSARSATDMKLSQRWRIHGIAGLTLVFLFCFVVTLFQSPRITEEAARNILPGMTLREVEDMLGPERDETDGLVIAPCIPGVKSSPRPTDERRWISERAVITALIDRETGCVAGAWCDRPALEPQSVWDRVGHWFRVRLGWGARRKTDAIAY
jgi:hypothetical protein